MSHAAPILFAADEVIFKEHDNADCAYLIESGTVLLYLERDGEELPLERLNKGEVLGQFGLLTDRPRATSARALGKVRAFRVRKSDINERVISNDHLVRLLVQMQNTSLKSKHSHGANDSVSHAVTSTSTVERVRLENRIEKALKNDELTPYYQPIYDLKTGELKGCEALMRWITKKNEIISPAAFMDVLEESPLMIPAGQDMMEKCARDFSKLSKTSPNPNEFFVSINVGGRQFMDLGFLPHLESTRLENQLEPKHLKLELTEQIMTEGEQAIWNLNECRARGYHLAIDDFGTGFSSLQYLARMPITHLKIDRMFVMNILADAKCLMIVKSLVNMADILGLKLIAEGIETKKQLDLLIFLRAEWGQGYLFSKPVPASEFIKLKPVTDSVEKK